MVLAIAVFGAAVAQAAAAEDAVATARQFANGIIAQAKVDDLFENVTNSTVPMLRHKRSGMICRFDPRSQGVITVFPGLPRGDDVACGTQFGGAAHTIYAIRPPRPLTLDQAFALYAREVVASHPGAKPYRGEVATLRAEAGAPAPRTARFELVDMKAPAFSRLSVAVAGDWVIEQRLTGLLPEAATLDAAGELLMREAVKGAVKP